jgi:hypothetical protein
LVGAGAASGPSVPLPSAPTSFHRARGRRKEDDQRQNQPKHDQLTHSVASYYADIAFPILREFVAA